LACAVTFPHAQPDPRTVTIAVLNDMAGNFSDQSGPGARGGDAVGSSQASGSATVATLEELGDCALPIDRRLALLKVDGQTAGLLTGGKW
jgi:hypothetical protein